jgi:hypothetical protein
MLWRRLEGPSAQFASRPVGLEITIESLLSNVAPNWPDQRSRGFRDPEEFPQSIHTSRLISTDPKHAFVGTCPR